MKYNLREFFDGVPEGEGGGADEGINTEEVGNDTEATDAMAEASEAANADLSKGDKSARESMIAESIKASKAATTSIIDSQTKLPDGVSGESVNKLAEAAQTIIDDPRGDEATEADNGETKAEEAARKYAESVANDTSATNTAEYIKNTTIEISEGMESSIDSAAEEIGGDKAEKLKESRTKSEDARKKYKAALDKALSDNTPESNKKAKAAKAELDAAEAETEAITNEVLDSSELGTSITAKAGKKGLDFVKLLMKNWRKLLGVVVGVGVTAAVAVIFTNIAKGMTGCYIYRGIAREKLETCKGTTDEEMEKCGCGNGKDDDETSQCAKDKYVYCSGECAHGSPACKGAPGADKSIRYAYHSYNAFNWVPEALKTGLDNAKQDGKDDLNYIISMMKKAGIILVGLLVGWVIVKILMKVILG